MLCALTACMDEHDEPTTTNYLITSPVSLGQPNYSIAELKSENKSLFSSTNDFQKFENDSIIEGIVCANDEGGNLYQCVLLRYIDESKDASDPLRDQCIQLAIKHTWLAPYFPIGQKVRVNLKGLYIGCYSKVPKIGQPYYTSSGNLRLGPILLELCRTNVELIGSPDTTRPECTPIECTPSWLANSTYSNNLYLYTPQLATVKGLIKEVQGAAKDAADIMPADDDSYPYGGDYEPLPKIFAPKVLCDAGYGVDRTLTNTENSTEATIRTSTQNDVAYLEIPEYECTYTGMLTYYSNWQVQVRSVNDIQRVIK